MRGERGVERGEKPEREMRVKGGREEECSQVVSRGERGDWNVREMSGI